MTELPAMSADEGTQSRPTTHLGFIEERVCSHYSEVVGVRETEKEWVRKESYQ